MNPLDYSIRDLEKIQTIQEMVAYWRRCVDEVERNGANPRHVAFSIVNTMTNDHEQEWVHDPRYPEYAIISNAAIALDRYFEYPADYPVIKSLDWYDIITNLPLLEEKLKNGAHPQE